MIAHNCGKLAVDVVIDVKFAVDQLANIVKLAVDQLVNYVKLVDQLVIAMIFIIRLH